MCRILTSHSQVSCTTIHTLQGISIRFPRLVRVRDDKTPEQATTATQVMHIQQTTSIRAREGTPGSCGLGFDESDCCVCRWSRCTRRRRCTTPKTRLLQLTMTTSETATTIMSLTNSAVLSKLAAEATNTAM